LDIVGTFNSHKEWLIFCTIRNFDFLIHCLQ
jgi:hypothetical protein